MMTYRSIRVSEFVEEILMKHCFLIKTHLDRYRFYFLK